MTIRVTINVSKEVQKLLNDADFMAAYEAHMDKFILSHDAETQAETYLIEAGILEPTCRNHLWQAWVKAAKDRAGQGDG